MSSTLSVQGSNERKQTWVLLEPKTIKCTIHFSGAALPCGLSSRFAVLSQNHKQEDRRLLPFISVAHLLKTGIYTNYFINWILYKPNKF